MANDDSLRVGELSRRTGVSIRTLHHYDEIGLLRPALGGGGRGGHRLYGRAEIQRLLQILALRDLGLSLHEIQHLLDSSQASPLAVINNKLEQLEQALEDGRRRRRRLRGITELLRHPKEVPVADLLRLIEAISRVDRQFSQAEQEELAQRADDLGEDAIRKAEAEWRKLLDQFRDQRNRGSDPASEPVRTLARNAGELIAAFTGGNPDLENKLKNLYTEHTDLAEQFGIEPELWSYLQQAMAKQRGQ